MDVHGLVELGLHKCVREIDAFCTKAVHEGVHHHQLDRSPLNDWGECVEHVLLEVTAHAVACLMLLDGAVAAAFASKGPSARQNSLPGVLCFLFWDDVEGVLLDQRRNLDLQTVLEQIDVWGAHRLIVVEEIGIRSWGCVELDKAGNAVGSICLC